MENYIQLDLIGIGSQGNKVYKVKNKQTNKIYAMKKLSTFMNDEKEYREYQNEISIFKQLKHINLIKYSTSFKHKDKLYIVMEYAELGDLSKIVKYHIENKTKIPEEKIWYYFIQLCRAINYMHSHKIIHRDIKLQNIFLNSNKIIKLGDFGISKILKNTSDFCKTPLGTPYFLSPEICMGKEYNYKSDIWMLGCSLYELITLKKPFYGNNITELINNILKKEIEIKDDFYSENLKKICIKLLQKNPDKRPFIWEIFNYDFINNKNQEIIIHDENKNKIIVNQDNEYFYKKKSELFKLKLDNLMKFVNNSTKNINNNNNVNNYTKKNNNNNYNKSKTNFINKNNNNNYKYNINTLYKKNNINKNLYSDEVLETLKEDEEPKEKKNILSNHKNFISSKNLLIKQIEKKKQINKNKSFDILSSNKQQNNNNNNNNESHKNILNLYTYSSNKKNLTRNTSSLAYKSTDSKSNIYTKKTISNYKEFNSNKISNYMKLNKEIDISSFESQINSAPQLISKHNSKSKINSNNTYYSRKKGPINFEMDYYIEDPLK